MSRWQVAVVGALISGYVAYSLSAASGSCIPVCNSQYQATVRYCTKALAKDGRRDVYSDCVKNAERFRLECLARCR